MELILCHNLHPGNPECPAYLRVIPRAVALHLIPGANQNTNSRTKMSVTVSIST